MPDFVYLLENRLNSHQLSALKAVREVAREARMPVFLVGDAVRDLVCGNSVRELEVVVHGNTADLKKPLVAHGATVWWESTPSRRISLRFPGSVLLEVSSARHTGYPKCGKPVYTWASIHEDLRSRDFTVNAMAISLNDGSYGLLMDPLNGVADLEVRQLRLVSNYGFLEEPARLVRASRLSVRLAFQLEERTLRRFENARGEAIIESLSEEERRRELEQILHEEEALKILAAHEVHGWMKALFPAWTTAKVDTEKLQALHDFSVELQMQGVVADLASAQAHYLTAKLSSKDQAALKEHLLRPGFVKAWEGLEADAAQLAKSLVAKENARPSACYGLLTSFAPEAVVWLGFTARQAAIKEKFEAFLRTWPQFRQKLPVTLMAEMRITPEIPGYAELAHRLFLRLIDGELQTEDEMRAFLEPFSPPAPPAPVSIKRSRSRRVAEIRVKARDTDDEDEEDAPDEVEDDGMELDFRIGDSDEGRILSDDDDDNDDDVFAKDSVSSHNEDAEDAEDDFEDAAEEKRKPVTPPSRVKAKPTKAAQPAPAKPVPASKKMKAPVKPAAKPVVAHKTSAAKAQVQTPLRKHAATPTPKAASGKATKVQPAAKQGKAASSPVSKTKPAAKSSAKLADRKAAARKPVARPVAKRPASNAKAVVKAKPAARKVLSSKAKAGKAAKPIPGKKKR